MYITTDTDMCDMLFSMCPPSTLQAVPLLLMTGHSIHRSVVNFLISEHGLSWSVVNNLFFFAYLYYKV